MELYDIIEAIAAGRKHITIHAGQEAENDHLDLADVEFSTLQGEILEDYLDDKPHPSCLIYGRSPAGDPIHSVWAYNRADRLAILITVYRPDPERWINLRERRR